MTQLDKTKLGATRSTSTLAAAVDTLPAPIESGADLNKEAPKRRPLHYNPTFRRFRLTQGPKRVQTAAAPTRRPAPATPLTPQAPTPIEMLESGAFACFQPPPIQTGYKNPAEIYPPVCGGTTGLRKALARLRGLSPRVRGNHSNRLTSCLTFKSIPACTGQLWPRSARKAQHARRSETGGHPQTRRAAQGRAATARLKERRLTPCYSIENSSPSSSIASGSQSVKNASGSSPRATKKDITSIKVAFSRSRNGSSRPT